MPYLADESAYFSVENQGRLENRQRTLLAISGSLRAMVAHRKTITATALNAGLNKAIAALPCLRQRSGRVLLL
jgi:hypothetical protein